MESHFIRPNRLLRMLHLIRFFSPSRLPVIHQQNAVELYEDGVRFFPALYEAIRKAERFVLVEYYIVRNDRTGNALGTELAVAARRGVNVFLIYDYIGSVETPTAFFRNLAAMGIEVMPFNVPSFRRGLRWFDRRDHRKMTIIDGKRAFLGGFNIGDEYSGLVGQPRRFYDLGFCIEGNAVVELVRIFMETWRMERGTLPFPLPNWNVDVPDGRPERKGDIAIVSGGPNHRHSRIRNTYLASIASAEEELLIITPYFVPGLRLIRAMLRAARRGVQVRLLLPARSDLPLVRLLARGYYGILLRKGIAIGEMEEKILHAKVMLIDGKQAVIGSANLDQRSFHRNYEVNVLIRDKALGNRVRDIHQKAFKNARSIVLADHEQRGLTVRALERFIGLFGWFL